MKTGILVAMDSELESLRKLAGSAELPPGVSLVLRKTGIGKVNAALGAAALIDDERPDCVLSTGCAGAISGSLAIGDTVAASAAAYHDVWCGPPNAPGQVQGLPPFFAAAPDLLAAAMRVPGMKSGLVATGDSFIDTEERRAAVLRVLPEAVAADMESAAIAHVCHLRGVPFISVRTISDAPGADPRFMQYESFWAHLAESSFAATRAFLENLPAKP